MARKGEFEWIEHYFAPLADRHAFALKDDASILSLPEKGPFAITQDAVLEGVHFLTSDPADYVARKALRVNISDCIAKGATPIGYSLALGVPDRWCDDDVALFAKGLAHDQKLYGITLTGGDTYRSPERLCVAITLWGHCREGRYIARLGAKANDLVFVSGTIGDGALGLKTKRQELMLDDRAMCFLNTAYQLPAPPFALASEIAHYATASMDISDGLVGDCRKLCAASQLSCVIDKTSVPLSCAAQTALQKDQNLWHDILTGGDDFQVLCTIPSVKAEAFIASAKVKNILVTQIGKMTFQDNRSKDDNLLVTVMDKGVPLRLKNDSFSHF